MALRVMHLGKYYAPFRGGIESHVQWLARAQAQLGLDVTVCCVSHDSALPATTCDDGVKVIRFSPWVNLGKFQLLKGLSDTLTSSRCDILHVHLPNPTMLFALRRLRRKVPYVVAVHSEVAGMPIRQLAFAPIQRRVVANASALVVTNPSLLTAPSLSRFSIPARCIALGIPLETYTRPAPSLLLRTAELRRTLEQPLWLMCGRLVPYKGHSIALQALAEVRGTLVVIGDGPLRPALEQQATRLNIARRVRFEGTVAGDELLAYYRAATALWLPSINRSEAFGLVQVEAMASGCPVINTAIKGSGVPWVSLNGVSGLTVPSGNHKALADAARSLDEDGSLRERLAEGARARAAAEFNCTNMAAQWTELYKHVLGVPPGVSTATAHAPS